jgi:signal peptidase I
MRHLPSDAMIILTDKRASRGPISDSKIFLLSLCAYRGTSMHPTLYSSDLLEISTYDGREIHVGDVIFFLSPHGGKPTVHRVARLMVEGLRTKGDSNNRIDPWVVRQEDVIGQVVRATRGNKRRLIHGGIVGLMWSLGIRGIKRMKQCLSIFYHLLAQSGLFRRLVPFHKQMRIVALHQKSGRAFKLFLGDRLIGNYQPGMAYWQIRRPFRLFVDIESLPTR